MVSPDSQRERLLDGAERGEAGERERGRLRMRHALGLLRHDGGLDGDLLGVGAVAAELEHAEHRVADAQIADAVAERADHSGEIPPQDIGKLRLPMRLAGAHLPVGAVDAGRQHVDHHLARLGRGIGQVAVAQDLRPAMLLNEDGFHGVVSSS